MTTYYVDPALGDNGNLGTSEGAGNAWLTLDYAMTQVADGDVVYAKASADYNETVNIITAGTLNSGILVEGYSTVPGDNGQITIDGQSTRTNGLLSALGSTCHVFKNIRIINHTSYGVNMSASDNIVFFNCYFTNNAGNRTVWVDNAIQFIHCEWENNSTGQAVDAGGPCRFIACRIVGASPGSLVFGGTMLFYRTIVSNSSTGATASLGNQNAAFGCVFDGNGVAQDGVQGSDGSIFVDCISIDSQGGRYAFGTTSETDIGQGLIFNNLWHNCSGGINQFVPNLATFDNIDDTDPLFVDAANGDYRLSPTSPAIDVGVMPGNIT